jgi:ABC-2 type transport system ATP-binding protein
VRVRWARRARGPDEAVFGGRGGTAEPAARRRKEVPITAGGIPDGAAARVDGAPALAVHGLAKRFGAKVAVAGIDLDIPHGCFYGLVGPNGAGKTTTLKMVTGLLRPDGGTVSIDGVDVWRDPVTAKRRIGVLPEDLRLFERLTGTELLTYVGLLRALPAGVVESRARELLVVLGLAEDAGTLVVDYSHGMRKKIALAAALLHAPRILFLDEPFEAIDPVSARTIREVLERFTRGGGTVVFSSHVMELVERLCDRVGIIHQGRLVAEGPLDRVRGDGGLEDAFVRLVGARDVGGEDLAWLRTS